MLEYIEVHAKNKTAVNLLNTTEKAMLLDMLLEYGIQELDISEISSEKYSDNRVVGAVYQMIVNDSI